MFKLIFEVADYEHMNGIISIFEDELYDIVHEYGFVKEKRWTFTCDRWLSQVQISNLCNDFLKVRDFKALVTSAMLIVDGVVNLQNQFDFKLGDNIDFEARQCLEILLKKQKSEPYLFAGTFGECLNRLKITFSFNRTKKVRIVIFGNEEQSKFFQSFGFSDKPCEICTHANVRELMKLFNNTSSSMFECPAKVYELRKELDS